jgi:hypothetical protein
MSIIIHDNEFDAAAQGIALYAKKLATQYSEFVLAMQYVLDSAITGQDAIAPIIAKRMEDAALLPSQIEQLGAEAAALCTDFVAEIDLEDSYIY